MERDTYKRSIIPILIAVIVVGSTIAMIVDISDKDESLSTKKSSGYWEFTSGIVIDDLVSGQDWAWAVSQPWCSGSGIETDPYVIENVTHTGGTSKALQIKNSDAHFVVRNFTVYPRTNPLADIIVYYPNNPNFTFIVNTPDPDYWRLSAPTAGIDFTGTYESSIQINITGFEVNNEAIDVGFYTFTFTAFDVNLGLVYQETITVQILPTNIVGISMENVDNGAIIDSNFRLLNKAIQLRSSHNNTIHNNVITDCTNYTIQMTSSNENEILNNDIKNEQDRGIGIFCITSNDSIISGNVIHQTDKGISMFGCDYNLVHDNTIKNNSVGIHAFDSRDNIISENTIDNNTFIGIWLLEGSDNNTISRNEVSRNQHGIWISGLTTSSSFNNITQNCACYNREHGITLGRSDDNIMTLNNITQNGLNGINIFSEAGDNSIVQNSITWNGYDAMDNGTNNAWDNESIGNYWRNYRGYDLDDDGIGDTPYNISGTANSQDRYPIVLVSTKPSIVINGSATGFGANNWAWAVSQPWCSGSGTLNDPYIIKDLVIEKGGRGDDNWNAISISDSDAHFVITNCTLLNAYYAGIQLFKVSNGLVVNNTYENCPIGIALFSSRNIIVKNNTGGMSLAGVLLIMSNWSVVLENTIYNCTMSGIAFQFSNNNGIFDNDVRYSETGIWLSSKCDENEISGNVVIDNVEYGILIHNGTSSSNNLIFNNKLINPLGINAQDNGTNNAWDNGIIGNFWHDYIGVDANNDSIGDTPYDISGTAGSSDRYPLMKYGLYITDNTPPDITIIVPESRELFGSIPPWYNVSIVEDNLDMIWYTVGDGDTKHFITELHGQISLEAWNAMPNGTVIITFYANDTAGNVGSSSVVVRKDISEESEDETIWDIILEFFLSFWELIIGLISSIFGLFIIGIYMKRRGERLDCSCIGDSDCWCTNE